MIKMTAQVAWTRFMLMLDSMENRRINAAIEGGYAFNCKNYDNWRSTDTCQITAYVNEDDSLAIDFFKTYGFKTI